MVEFDSIAIAPRSVNGVGIDSRSLLAGPQSKCHFLSKREPWHGAIPSALVSVPFYNTSQVRTNG